jgi:hypothetical protein
MDKELSPLPASIVRFSDGKYGLRVYWFFGWKFLDIVKWRNDGPVYRKYRKLDDWNASFIKTSREEACRIFEEYINFQNPVREPPYKVLDVHTVVLEGKNRIGRLIE